MKNSSRRVEDINLKFAEAWIAGPNSRSHVILNGSAAWLTEKTRLYRREIKRSDWIQETLNPILCGVLVFAMIAVGCCTNVPADLMLHVLPLALGSVLVPICIIMLPKLPIVQRWLFPSKDPVVVDFDRDLKDLTKAVIASRPLENAGDGLGNPSLESWCILQAILEWRLTRGAKKLQAIEPWESSFPEFRPMTIEIRREIELLLTYGGRFSGLFRERKSYFKSDSGKPA